MPEISEQVPEVPKPSPNAEEDAIVKAIDAINTDYGKSLEELGDAETDVQELENEMFKMFLNVRKNKDAGTADEYDDMFSTFVEKKQVVFAKQTRSFKLLQKLRASHNNYLTSIITGMQAKINELMAEKSPREASTPVAEASTSKLSSKAPL